MGKTFKRDVDKLKPSKWDKKRKNKRTRYDKSENPATDKSRFG